MSSIKLSNDELTIVDTLIKQKVFNAYEESLLFVIMFTRGHIRPRAELIHILKQYPGLSEILTVNKFLDRLISKKIIIDKETSDYSLLYVNTNPTISGLTSDTISALKRIRDSYSNAVTNYGPVYSEESYISYLDRLKLATNEICLPMLATSPNIQSVDILKRKAANGVKIKILLGSPSIIASLRGISHKNMANECRMGWKDQLGQFKNVEIRVMSDVADADIATCLLIDNNILRLTIYDSEKQRSLQGTLIEVANQDNLNYNMIKMFREKFDNIWEKAITPDRFSLKRFVLKHKGFISCLGCIIFAFIHTKSEDYPLIQDLCIAAFSPLFIVFLKSLFSFINDVIRRLKG